MRNSGCQAPGHGRASLDTQKLPLAPCDTCVHLYVAFRCFQEQSHTGTRTFHQEKGLELNLVYVCRAKLCHSTTIITARGAAEITPLGKGHRCATFTSNLDLKGKNWPWLVWLSW